MELRPYQLEAVEAVEKEWKAGHKRTLLVLPTGCGKTICFAKIAERQVDKKNKVLILAHRGELLEQAEDKLYKTTGIHSALEKADDHAAGTALPVVVGSVQTLQKETRLNEFKPDEFKTIIVDEAHHALSNSYQKVLEYFNTANVLGVTATPDRGDMKNLGEYFESLAYEYSLPQAIKEGYLCKIKAQTIPLRIDLSKVKISQGDYSSGDLGDALAPYLDQIADIIAKHYSDRKMVVFLPLVSTSQEFESKCRARGLKVWEVNGNSKDRAEVLEAFEKAKTGILCNSMLLTEGWDCPSVDCVVVLRPTKIRSLYAQMVGRGTRLYPGKDHLLILDFLWHTMRHELSRPTCLIAKKKEVAQALDEKMQETGEVFEISEETIEKANAEAREQREAALARLLEEQRSKKAKLVDPLQFEMSILDEDLQNYEPIFAWEFEEASEKQLETIEKFGISARGGMTKGYASKLMDRLVKRSKNGLTSPKQIRCLERYGFRNVGTWAFEDANNMISILARYNWALPGFISPETYVPKSLRGN